MGQVEMMNQPEDSSITYDYFLCVKRNDMIYDIDGKDQFELCEEAHNSDHDSDDSNRSSADGNDYPDEDNEEAEEDDYKR